MFSTEEKQNKTKDGISASFIWLSQEKMLLHK